MCDRQKWFRGLQRKLGLGSVVLLVGIATQQVSGQEERHPADSARVDSRVAPPSPPVAESDPGHQSGPGPFEVGERLAYRVSWSETLEAGTAELRVASKDSKAPHAYRLVLEARSNPEMESIYRLNFQCSSLFDWRHGASREYRKSFEENRRIVRESIIFNPPGRSATFVNSRKESRELTIELGAQDPVSAIYLVRSLGLKPGLRVIFPIVEGGETYEIDVIVVGSELISTALGSFSSQRVEAVLRRGGDLLEDRKMTFWFTHDQRRIPVLASVALPFGSVLVELISVSWSDRLGGPGAAFWCVAGRWAGMDLGFRSEAR